VTGPLVLIILLYVAGTPVPNNLLQMKEGMLVPNPLLYTTGTVISKSSV
jgi:hypothetical protein